MSLFNEGKDLDPLAAALSKSSSQLMVSEGVSASGLDFSVFLEIFAATSNPKPQSDDNHHAAHNPHFNHLSLPELGDKQYEQKMEIALISAGLCHFNVRARKLYEQIFGGRGENANWISYPLVVTQVSDDFSQIEVSTLREYRSYVSISHRWSDYKEGVKMNPTVTVMDGSTQVAQFEIKKIHVEALELAQRFTSQGIPLWLDHLCIIQTSDEHKSAQVSIMGGIYACSTTIIVDEKFGFTMLDNSYFKRTWTFQEYAYGSTCPIYWLEMNHELKTEEFNSRKNIEGVMLWGGVFGTFFPFGNQLYQPGRAFPSDWHMHNNYLVNAVGKKYGDFYMEFCDVVAGLTRVKSSEALQVGLLQTLRTQKAAMIAILLSRFDFGQLTTKNGIQLLAYAREMDVKYPKDRLYGIFGVTMKVLRGIDLDYRDPVGSMTLVREAFKTPHVAFQRVDSDPFCSDGQVLSKLEQITLVPDDDPCSPYQQEKLRIESEPRRLYNNVRMSYVEKLHRTVEIQIKEFEDLDTGNHAYLYEKQGVAPLHGGVWFHWVFIGRKPQVELGDDLRELVHSSSTYYLGDGNQKPQMADDIARAPRRRDEMVTHI